MALVLNDRVKETTTTTGTGTINLAGAATNFETFVAGIGDGNTVYYAIVHQDQPEFEVGLGTVTDATPDTLSRTTILSSSNSDGLVSFSAGTKDVFCTLPASKTVFEDGSGNLNIKTSVDNSVTQGLVIERSANTDKGYINYQGGAFRFIATDGDPIKIGHVSNTDIVEITSGGVLAVNSGTTNTVATFTSTDSGAGFNLTDDSGTSTIQTNGANLRVGVDEDGAVSSSAIQFRVDGSTKATINDSGVLDVDGGITVDDITIDGTEIDLSSGDLTIDVAGDITLDADGGEILLKDGGTEVGRFLLDDNNHLKLKSIQSDADILFQGNDGGSGITALRFDMSDAGTATFNHDIKLGDNGIAIFGDSSDLQIYHDGSNSYIDEQGTGNLYIRATHFLLQNASGRDALTAVNNDVFLKSSGIIKLQTTSTGVDVTGDVGATTATIAGDITQTTGDYLYTGGGNFDIKHTIASQNIVFSTTPSGGSTAEVLRITHDGKLSKLSGDLTIDVAGNIQLDADDAGEVRFLDGGTQYAAIKKDSNDAVVQSIVADGDLRFNGIDDSSVITALRLDMSEGGNAIFNSSIDVGGSITKTGDLTLDVSGDITLDADGGTIVFKDAGTEIGFFALDNSGFFDMLSSVSDADIRIRGNDGGSTITALTLDMSEAGAATFNDNVTAFSDERLKNNIETLEHGLAKVEQLRGVTYTRDGRENIGVIAQEVEKILPEIVLTADDEMGTKSVDYSRLTAVLIEAVKELSERVKELENK